MRKAIIGTAGHVDHGKTALLKALTGVDCDRWKEEKLRGITIDLGFTSMTDDDIQVGFVDVPGHERFIKNMLAGSGSIDAFLLVISAEEGVKPQTVEHVEILKYLNVTRGICALTKTDLVDEDLMELAAEEVGDFLNREMNGTIPVIPTSAQTLAGMEELKHRILDLVRALPESSEEKRPLKLPIDRAFHLKGIGTIVTGSLIRGSVTRGDRVYLLPDGIETRVRSIQVHGDSREQASAKERTSLNLAGIELGSLHRGQMISSVKFPSTYSILVEGHFLQDVKNNQRVRIHHHTMELFGRLHLIQSEDRYQVALEKPAPILRGDHVVIRKYSPQDLIGGGFVLDTSLPRLRRSRHPVDDISDLDRYNLNGWRDLWLKMSGIHGLKHDTLSYLTGYPAPGNEPESLPGSAHIGEVYYHPDVLKRMSGQFGNILKKTTTEQPWLEGIPTADILSRMNIRHEPLLHYLCQRSNFVIREGKLYPDKGSFRSEHSSELSLKLEKLIADSGDFIEKKEIISTMCGEGRELSGILADLIREGKIIRFGTDLFLHTDQFRAMLETLRASGWESFSVGQFKDLFGISRKYAIPFLEYLDGQRITIRRGNDRVLLSPKK